MKKAFTLVELLVAIALIMMVSGFAIAGWTNFRANRTLENQGLELTVFLRSAKSKAVNGEKPTDAACAYLDSYQVTQSSNAIIITPRCVNDSGVVVDISGSAETFSIAASLSIASTNLPVGFKSLEGSAGSDATITLTHDQTGRSGTITISSAGEITWQRS